MVFVEVCVGSSCHLKGAPEVVELLRQHIEDNGLEENIILSGCFCTGHCNPAGVTVKVNEEIITGVNAANFSELWNEKVLPATKEQ